MRPSLDADADYRLRAIRAAAALAVESLETRRLFAYSIVNTVDAPALTDPMLGDIIMATQGNLALIGQPGANGGIGQVLLIDTSVQNPDGINNVLQTFDNPAATPDTNDAFGFAVAFVGNRIAISAPDEFGGDEPAVYIYDDYADDVPEQVIARPVSHDGTNGGFGRTLTAFDSDSLLVAEPFAKVSGLDEEGIVEMYDVTDSSLEATFESLATSGDQLGNAMAANGSRVLLSSITPGGTVVLEFDANGGTVPLRTITLPNAAAGLALAYGAAGEVIVGDSTNDAVYVYDAYSGGPTSNLQLTITGDPFSLFGLDIAVRGSNELLVGAMTGDTAYLFDYTATGSLVLADAADELEGPPGTGFGYGTALGVSTSGFVVADFAANSSDGALYVFEDAPPPPIVVTAALDGQGNLTVTGTGNAESIVVLGVNGLTRVLVNNVQLGSDFAATGKVVILGGAGGDTLTSDKTNTLPTEIYGGDGNDVITGGGGDDLLFGEGDDDSIFARQANDVVVGGDGNDTLYGGQGRDVLIGGDGADHVEGEQADDILVAGFTAHDNDLVALAAIRTTWLSTSDYATRVSLLSNGLLDPDTDVFDDGDVDTVVGGQGQDWFLVQASTPAQDVIVDLKKSEAASDIDAV